MEEDTRPGIYGDHRSSTSQLKTIALSVFIVLLIIIALFIQFGLNFDRTVVIKEDEGEFPIDYNSTLNVGLDILVGNVEIVFDTVSSLEYMMTVTGPEDSNPDLVQALSFDDNNLQFVQSDSRERKDFQYNIRLFVPILTQIVETEITLDVGDIIFDLAVEGRDDHNTIGITAKTTVGYIEVELLGDTMTSLNLQGSTTDMVLEAFQTEFQSAIVMETVTGDIELPLGNNLFSTSVNSISTTTGSITLTLVQESLARNVEFDLEVTTGDIVGELELGSEIGIIFQTSVIVGNVDVPPNDISEGSNISIVASATTGDIDFKLL